MLLPTILKYALINKTHTRLTKEQIKEMQMKKFRKLIVYVSRHSHYYSELIKNNNITVETCKPEDFPILTKEIVMDHFDEIVTDQRITKEKISSFLSQSQNPSQLFLNKYYVINTSGS